jgi:hypothetical protein
LAVTEGEREDKVDGREGEEEEEEAEEEEHLMEDVLEWCTARISQRLCAFPVLFAPLSTLTAPPEIPTRPRLKSAVAATLGECVTLKNRSPA